MIKLQKTAASIGFVRYALHNGITPKFAQVRGNFRNGTDKKKAEESILKFELSEHRKSLIVMSSKLNMLTSKLKNLTTPLFYRYLLRKTLSKLRKKNIEQLKTKTRKLHVLLNSRRSVPPLVNESVPIINLSSYNLDYSALKFGLNQCFVDKNKFVRRTIATEFEALASTIDSFVEQHQKENLS